MKRRMNVAEAVPELYASIRSLDGAVVRSGLDPRLLHLVKLRASQINGCAYCVDLHVKEARAAGISEQVLHLLPVWEESPLFNARDRAALAWTENLTLLAESGVSDSMFEAVSVVFSIKEIAQLTIAIGTINVWNRIAVSSRMIHPIDHAIRSSVPAS